MAECIELGELVATGGSIFREWHSTRSSGCRQDGSQELQTKLHDSARMSQAALAIEMLELRIDIGAADVLSYTS